MEATGRRTLIADGPEGNRKLTLAALDTSTAGPAGPAELFSLGKGFDYEPFGGA
ncbi:MAG: hypothetical protein ACXWDJ_08780 [Aeromicrobium sp.]